MRIKRHIVFLIVAVVLIGCKPKKVIVPPVLGDVDPSSIVAIGGSGIAGYSDDALHNSSQEYSVINIVIDRINGTNNVATYNQPLINETSFGINENGDSRLVLGYKTDCNNETSLSPIREALQGVMGDLSNSVYSEQGPFNNLGVPFARILDINTSGYGNPANGVGNYNPWFARMASDQSSSSILSDAAALDPTFFFISLGQSDIMEYATSGGTGTPIPPLVGAAGIGFEGSLDEIIATLNVNGAHGAIANIPDVLAFPYFTTIPYNGLNLDADQVATINSVFNPLGITFEVGENGFTMEDPSEPFGVRKMVEGELVLLSIPLDSVKCYGMGSITPIPDKYVLTLDEIAEINFKGFQYGNAIFNRAQSNDLAFVEANSLYLTLQNGIVYNGVSMNTEFVTGGFFSLDGRNLNPIGQALLANRYIEAINEKFNAQIPHAPVTNYPGVVFP